MIRLRWPKLDSRFDRTVECGVSCCISARWSRRRSTSLGMETSVGYRNAVGCGQARRPKSSVVFIVGDGDKESCPILSFSVGLGNSMTF